MREIERTETGWNASRGGDFAVGVLCGAFLGAAVALLMAPKSGAELRHHFAWSAKNAKRSAKDGYAHASDVVRDVVRDVVDDAIVKGRVAADEVIQRGKKVIS